MLISTAHDFGYEIALGEGADFLTEKDPTSDHMANSCHHIGLAQDIALYKDGKYLTDSKDYESLGIWWVDLGNRLGFPLRWGGYFKKADGSPAPDGNHFSWEWAGRK
jgi:hypothetical protein